MRGIGGAVTAGLAAWSAQAKTILHISDVHLNLTLDEMNYGFDSSPRLLESALSYARSVLHDPDLLLYTGDAVAHIDHNESVLAKTVQTGFSMVQEYFHVKNVTAILGNADFHDYEFYVTDPEKGGTNPTIGMVDAPWKQALSPSHFEAFDSRGYLWYQIEPKLVVISLNTVPYSVKHKPDTKYLDDPFNQFEWLRRTLVEVQTNGSYAYIVGHIPPIIDSYGGESQWELKYMLTYQAIVEAFPDIIKAQALEWTKIFSAKAAYGLPSLSSESLRALTHRMKADDGLLHEYYRHSKADSTRLPPCTTSACLDKVLCTQTWFSTVLQYRECLDEQSAERIGIPHWLHPFPRISWMWSLVLWAAVIVVVAVVVGVVHRALKRSSYQTIPGPKEFEP
ncbi:hypothetical protein DYB38_010094 [Aphanomyces astaci]|uniref:Calcineurin-like phosphoesterase domain-containing protein n=1 Tax=Aphanomyces astaci TaxID=112090 RepID=A0A397DRS9_APHAT|nr:hypothetical protein DYB38_010094 [Aphanomyces astaci]